MNSALPENPGISARARSRRFLSEQPLNSKAEALAECCTCIGVNQWCSGLSRETSARPAIPRGGRRKRRSPKTKEGGEDSRISAPVGGCLTVRSSMLIDGFGAASPRSFRVVGATTGRCTRGNRNSEKICPRFQREPKAPGFSNQQWRNPASIGRTSVAIEPEPADRDSRNIQSVFLTTEGEPQTQRPGPSSLT